MSTQNEPRKIKKEAFKQTENGLILPLPVHSYEQTLYDVQSLINVSRTALSYHIENNTPNVEQINEVQICLSIANAITERLCYDIEILDKIK